MFGRKSNEDVKLNEAIERILDEMETYGPDSPEYPGYLDHLERLYALKTEESPRRVSPDAIIQVAGNILGILVIVAYEQKHVMTSKGLGFVMKPK